ncbi:hypothetical protein WJX72_005060 [[Myrmecia] bisecta]|uniref:Fe/B12 periplasmic-binding domain-containing protein n=1 Tax=[Myrmecia] bisecta TaxID=41462 RepID=A0AAW1PQ46_9CHLO
MKLEDVLQDILNVGKAVHMEQAAKEVVAGLQARIDRVVAFAVERAAAWPAPPKVAFLEWLDPVFPGGHWTPQLIEMAGGAHPLNPTRGPGKGAPPSFAMPHDAVIEADCDWIILCPCGLDMDTCSREALAVTTQAWWQELRAVKDGKVVMVDGHQMFNRPGPRLVDALEWLVGLLHAAPELMPRDFPWKWWQPAPALEPPAAPVSAEADRNQQQMPGFAPASAIGMPETGTSSSHCHVNGTANGAGLSSGSVEHGVDDDNGSDMLGTVPGLAPEIEEAHRASMEAGISTYIDPTTGYSVFTEDYLRRKGPCCGNMCRHCPYAHYKVEPWRGQRKNRILVPTLLQAGKKGVTDTVKLVVWLGDVQSHITHQLLCSATAVQSPEILRPLQSLEPVLVVATHRRSGGVWGRPGATLSRIMDQGRRLYRHMIVVPFDRTPDPSSAGDVRAAVQAACELLGGKVKHVCLPPTLHKQDVQMHQPCSWPLAGVNDSAVKQQWEKDTFQGHVKATVTGQPGKPKDTECTLEMRDFDKVLQESSELWTTLVEYKTI